MEVIRNFLKKPARLSKMENFCVRDLFEKFEVFYVCFDEPNRAQTWATIQSSFPKAKKVEGVVGFDRALKRCAEESRTDYFLLIDGDNRLLTERFLRPVQNEGLEDHFVLSWSSLNPVNGLAYGNGGLKLWPKKVALAINSHENAEKGDDQTDYCFIADYYLVDDFVTETIMNSTYKQAFRAGFREGVKMSLAWGKQVELNFENFEQVLGWQNRERLKVWCEIGNDSINGCWGILGARLGVYHNVVEKFDYRVINSYEWIDNYLEKKILPQLGLTLKELGGFGWSREGLKNLSEEIGLKINQKIPLHLKEVSPLESMAFKKAFKNPMRSGLLGRNPQT